VIYLHEARGADRVITQAIDAHVNTERGKRNDGPGDDGSAELMAR